MKIFISIITFSFIIFVFVKCNTTKTIVTNSISKKIIESNKIQKSYLDDTAMVASARIEASIVANQIMKDGGNAIDAAISTQMVLAVTLPVAGNIGGGGFMIIRMNDGAIDALDFREKAPLKASKDMYLDNNGNPDSNISQTGPLAVGVPGSVDGMVEAFKKYSKIKDWKRLIQPAIDIANNGFIITTYQAKLLNNHRLKFLDNNTVKNAFTKDIPWKNGDIFIQKDLAYTLELIRDHGRDGFYKGVTAEKIVAEMRRSNGLITQEDLDKYHAIWRTPVTTDYRGHKIISMPPPSSGGIALIQLLEMIEPYDIKTMGWQTVETIHLMVEAERRVYADRAKHLGDSDFYPVPMNEILDAEYLKKRMSDFNKNKSTSSDQIDAGNIDLNRLKESTETTHYSIVDPYGNAVAITTTLNGYFGSKVVVGNAGFLLNNEMDDFSSKPGTPNLFGLLGAEANKIEPEKRMLSSMTPTIVEKDGKFMISIGTPGGATIITSVFQSIVNIIDHGMTATEAITAKRFHHQWKPDVISIEKGAFSPEVSKKLNAMGHKFKEKKTIGRVEAILVKGKVIEGAADPRGDDDVRGY